MADIRKQTDGPEPFAPAAFDHSLLPDADNDFVNEADFAEFTKALQAPETSPSTEDLTAPTPEPRKFITPSLNVWTPINPRSWRRKKHKKRSRRGKDETREGIFYHVLRWPLLLFVLGWLLFLSIGYILTRVYIYQYEQRLIWRGRRQKLRQQLQEARSYEDWVKGAQELDSYLKNDAWKEESHSSYYNSKVVQRDLNRMTKLRQRAQAEEEGRGTSKPANGKTPAEELRNLLEDSFTNNLLGCENPRLYKETYYGTKSLVQNFVDEAERSLRFLLSSTQLSRDSKGALFRLLTINFGRTALCLSGGGTLAYYHFGVAKALLDAGLLPEVITGTSGGALVAALLGTRTDEELKQLLVPALAHRITACHESFGIWFKRWRQTGARFDSVDWAKRCAWFTRGNMTFMEAYKRTGRILNITCVPLNHHTPFMVINYKNSPDCVIWSVVLASAAVPGILNPVVLMRKNPDGTLAPYYFGHKWKDGSFRTDIPLEGVERSFRVRFSIVSQVNPHIGIFLFSPRGTVGRPVAHRRGRGWQGGFIGSAIEKYIKLDLLKWLGILRGLELFPRPLNQDWSQIWLQRFSGTITIWPKTLLSDLLYILTDPTPERLARMIRVGQLCTFPKLKFVANRAKLEHVILQGYRQYASRDALGGNIASILSEDDLQSHLKRSKNTRGDSGPTDPMSGSEYSSSAGPSRPSSPLELPFGFSFPPKRDRTPAPLTTTDGIQETEKNPIPDSPSLGKRLTDWWSSTNISSPGPRLRNQRILSPPLASPNTSHRPNSMFELRPQPHLLQSGAFTGAQPASSSSNSASPGRGASFLKELRRQNRHYVDDSSDDENAVADFGPAEERYDGRSDQPYDVDGGAEDYVGDDEDEGIAGEGIEERAETKNVGVGLGLE